MKHWMTCVALAVLAGCSQAPAPDAQMQLSRQALEHARQVLAGQHSSTLEAAGAGLAQAEMYLAEQDHKQARLLAEQAELDARLAEVEGVLGQVRQQQRVLEAELLRLHQQLGEVAP